MTTPYQPTANGALSFCDTAAQFGISAATNITYTVPGDNAQKYIVIFRFPQDAKVWVGLNKSATLPVANTMTAVNGIEMNPKYKIVKGADVLNFNSTSAVTDAGITLFTIPG